MIKTYPNKILRTFCQEVPKNAISDYDGLIETMEKVILDFNALGLAANQIGEDVRIIGICPDGENSLRFLINPVIIETGGAEIQGPEACLSFPGVLTTIKRPSAVKVKFFNEEAEAQEEEFFGKEAVIIQHEIDHLDGITLVQRAPKVMRDQIMRQLKAGLRKMKKYRKVQNRLKRMGKQLAEFDEKAKEASESEQNA